MAVETLLYPNIAPSRCGFNIVAATSLETTPMSRVEYVTENAGEKFFIELYYNVLERSEALLLRNFLHKLRGSLNKTLIKDWTYQASANFTGSPLVRGSNEHGLELNIDGLSASQAFALAGDRFKLGERVHEITDDVIAAGDTTAVLSLANEIIDIPLNNTPLILDPELLTVKSRWTNPQQITQFQGNKRYYRDIRLSFMESLS